MPVMEAISGRPLRMQALKGGVTCVQLREKELDETAFLQEAKELCALCRPSVLVLVGNTAPRPR